MNRKTIAIITELIPVVSALVSIILILSDCDSEPIRRIILITTVLAFLGFAFFIVGRKLAREDRLVRILGLLDWLGALVPG